MRGHQSFSFEIAKKIIVESEGWRLTSNPLGEGEEVVIQQPQQPSGVVRVTEMLRRLNSQAETARRGSDSEEERTSRSVSRRSSGGDSGLGNLSESELLDQENTERPAKSGQEISCREITVSQSLQRRTSSDIILS